MSVSLDKLVDQVNSKIVAGGQNPIDTARLVGSVEALESRYSVANVAALPTAALNAGRFIYVEDIEAYRYSDGTQWTNDYDTTLTATSEQLWVWGNNGCGSLGDGTLTTSCSPVREFCSATDWRQVSAGWFHNAAIKTSGELWVWGQNNLSQLGDGTITASCSPIREFYSATDWCQVSAGACHNIAIKTSGQIWGWGRNLLGVLGDGTTTCYCSPVQEFCSATDWCQVSTGCIHTTAIKTSGELWVWGYNGCGRFGDGTTTNSCSPVREICSATDWCQTSAGISHTASVKTSGELWTWGLNGLNISRLGDGTTTDKCSPVREICSATDWCQVSTGSLHTTAIKTSGELWAWGWNGCGRLGDGATTAKCSPVREICSATDWCQTSAGVLHTLAVKTSGELWVWGSNNCGRLGDGTTTTRCSPVREICSATDWCQVSAGCAHTIAIKATFKGFNEP
jgi:alpha-tubulin suppressor-like RCC1 family protein